MFCRYCGASMPDNYKFCADCGTPILSVQPNSSPATDEVKSGSAPINEHASSVNTSNSPYSKWANAQPEHKHKPIGKRKKTAGLLGIFLGFFGVHRFYLGYTEIAFFQILLGVLGFVTFGITALGAWIWAIVDAIRIFKGKINKDADDNLLI